MALASGRRGTGVARRLAAGVAPGDGGTRWLSAETWIASGRQTNRPRQGRNRSTRALPGHGRTRFAIHHSPLAGDHSIREARRTKRVPDSRAPPER